MDDRLITSSMTSFDEAEISLRPQTFDEYIGQEKAKSNLSVFIEACKMRNDTLDHVLLYGPPGLGKTTLSNIIASELGVNIKVTSGPALERAGDLAAILTKLEENDILFIDEIHALNRTVEEKLYSAMEDFAFDIVLGKGPAATSMRINLNKFTLIGATTRVGRLTAPFRDRFGIVLRLEMYSPDELSVIIKRSAKILNAKIDETAAYELARRSRGTPRIANRLLKRVRDFADVQHSAVTGEVVNDALDKMDVDKLGLDDIDIRMLRAMIERFNGGPVGLDTIAAAINEDPVTIEDVLEPYLLRIGFIARTARGRICLKNAYQHLGYALKEDAEKQISMYEFIGDEQG